MNTLDPKDKQSKDITNSDISQDITPENDQPVEGSWDDEEDEDFDDQTESRTALNDVQEGGNMDLPAPEDDDHLPDDFLN
ncbi:MAG: hypothetical protein EOP46_18575 [Sphingobacteriaceae bacterium]|nr:MAG: hypothetical protein EOP46_18575 [Sphingobacteriaceae bacterium]